MDGNKEDKDTQTPPYPLSVDEWREAIGSALNLTIEEGRSHYKAGTFPFDNLLVWIRREFDADEGYSHDFVPALIRNARGLVGWIYGSGSEPNWSGHDKE